VEHEPRNGINLCDNHHSDFDSYRFFIRWVPSVSRNDGSLSVVLDANHHHSPFPAPFLIQEMRTREFHPWCTDRPIHYLPLTLGNNLEGGVANLRGGSHTGVGLGGSGGAASSGSELPSTGINQQYLVLGNPFQDPELLESMRRQWQQLPN
jgi:hypothetical protein